MSGSISVVCAFVAVVWDSFSARLSFVVAAAASLVVAAYFVWREKDKELEEANQKLAAKQQRRAVRDQLGAFLAAGSQFMQACRNEEAPPPESDANAWAGEVQAFLAEHFGQSYVARLHNGQGLLPIDPGIKSANHRAMWHGLRIRVIRLEQFLAELGAD
jgi:hypothetical protein